MAQESDSDTDSGTLTLAGGLDHPRREQKRGRGTRDERLVMDTGCTQSTHTMHTIKHARADRTLTSGTTFTTMAHNSGLHSSSLKGYHAHSLTTHSLNLNSTQLRTHDLRLTREKGERGRRKRGEVVADTHCGVSRASCVDVGGALSRRDASCTRRMTERAFPGCRGLRRRGIDARRDKEISGMEGGG
jgi:hypothetical protein